MISPTAVIIAFWLLFYGYWAISAIGVKRNIRLRMRWQGRLLRVLLLVAILLLTRLQHVYGFSPHLGFSPLIRGLGVALCALGLAFAVWARVTLGRNWGVPMSLKEGHELVTAGPYRLVRHPIYTGILFAMLGSAVAAGRGWLIIFIAVCPYLAYSARTEEGLMMQQFPNEYPEYKKRTKALIPFIW